jgi:cytochrome c553
MKKLGIVSLALAALLLSGCNQKSEEHKAQKAQHTQEQTVKHEAPAAKPAPKAEAKSAGDQAPAQAVAEEAKKTQEAAKEAQEEVAKPAEAKAEAGAKVEEAKKEATAKVEEAKEAVAQKGEEVKAAVDGAKLFAKCASCHGPKGDRKALGKSAPIAGMAKEEVLKKLKEYQAGTLNQYGMGPLMKGQVAGMSEAELEALADYISKLK